MIEMLTVIAIIAVAASLAAPSMASFIRSNRVAGEMTALSAAIRMAKSEAIKRGAAVQLCASANSSSCSGKDVWSNGWIIYVDKNKNEELDTGEEVFSKEQSFKAGDALTASVSAININAEGFAYKLPSAGHIIFTLQTEPVDDQAQRCLLIEQTASPVIRKKGEANCA